MTKEQTLVAEAAAKFAIVEKALSDLDRQCRELRDAVKAAHMAGVGRSVEFLKIDARLASAAGRIADVLETIVATHERATAIAKHEGHDAVLPGDYVIAPRSGGDR